MNADLVKKIGRIHEQIEMEYKSRRNYPIKWSKFYQETPWKDMYNQNEINKQIKSDFKVHNNPFAYAKEGDAYFISPEMHKSLVAVCRCGRPRSDLHLLKCLQSQLDKYSINSVIATNDGNKNTCIKKLPQTSSAFVGWQLKQPNYKQWEDSMKYISPVYDMPGKKITATTYNTIFIG